MQPGDKNWTFRERWAGPDVTDGMCPTQQKDVQKELETIIKMKSEAYLDP